MAVIDFGWDWEKFEKNGIKYRKRVVAGYVQLQIWIPNKDEPSIGHWENVKIKWMDEK